MNTLERENTQNSDNIVKQFLYSRNICTVAMEIGSTWEEKAFQKYKCVMQSEKHTNLKVMKSGLFISDNVILGASQIDLLLVTVMAMVCWK